MKKIFFLGLAIVALTMASCTKDYMCTWDVGGEEFTQNYNDLDKEEADAAEAACNLVSGTFAEQ